MKEKDYCLADKRFWENWQKWTEIERYAYFEEDIKTALKLLKERIPCECILNEYCQEECDNHRIIKEIFGELAE